MRRLTRKYLNGPDATLKIVAKYSDACNIFGSVETVKKKLGVLREHCRSVGRDYDSIVKSRPWLLTGR